MKKLAAAVPVESYSSWATKIAADYLERGIPLKDGVRTIAREHHLNPEQIKRTAEAANIATYQQLLPKRDGGDVRFDPAVGGKIVQEFNEPSVSPPSTQSYQELPPQPKVSTAALQVFPQDIVGPEITKMAQEALDLEEGILDEKDVRDILGKLETALEAVQLDLINTNAKLAHAQASFHEDVRQSLLAEHPPDEMYKVALARYPALRDSLADLFAGAFSKLAARGYIKIGTHVKVGTHVPPELISKRLKEFSPDIDVVVVNGSHPIFRSVDTIVDLSKDRDKQELMTRTLKERVAKAKSVFVRLLQGSRDARSVGGLTHGGRR